MLSWIIQITIISTVLIFLIHYLINFFKSTLTVPKIKDLVNSPTQKYESMYNVINQKSDPSPPPSPSSTPPPPSSSHHHHHPPHHHHHPPLSQTRALTARRIPLRAIPPVLKEQHRCVYMYVCLLLCLLLI